MREKTIEIINNSRTKLNAIEILNMIKKDNTVEDLSNLTEILDDLCKEGIIRTASGNAYFKNDLLCGRVDVHEKGNAHFLVKDGEDIYINKNNLKGACNNDTVLVEIIDAQKNEGKVVKILERNMGNSIGEVVSVNGKLKIYPISKLPYNLIVKDTDLDIFDGHLVKLKYVKDIDKNNILCEVDKIIAHKNEPDSDVKMIAYEFDIPIEFREETLKEAKAAPKDLNEEIINEALNSGVEDFRNEIVITIDGKDTKDIDDAISFKYLENGNRELAVHIANVSRYVNNKMSMWEDAYIRGNSNYLGDKVIPMLPIELSNGICSLNPLVDRFTLSCIMEIDNSGKVVNSRITRGIIKSRKKMNYDAVQDIIEDKETEDTKDYTTLEYIAKENDTLESIAFSNNLSVEELKKYNNINEVKKGTVVNVPARPIIKNMLSLSKTLKAKKQRRGELEFLSDEKKYIYDEKSKVKDIEPRVQRDAEKIIEDFMIVANETVATTVFEKALPFVYRLHGVPSPKSIDEFMKFLSLQGAAYTGKIDSMNVSSLQLQDLLEFLNKKFDEERYKVINKKLLKCMQKAYYGTDNIGHYGIASPCYTHFTSPIRRFSDLLVHTLLEEYLINKNLEDKYLKNWASYLTVACEHISETERISEKAEYAYDDMAMAEYMEGYIDENGNLVGGHIGEEYDAVINTCLQNSFFVQTNNFVEGRVDLNTLNGTYKYNSDLMGYEHNNKITLRLGDKVRVKCIDASKQKRTIDFTLVRKK